MSAHAIRPLAEGDGARAAGAALGRLDREPRRRRRRPPPSPSSDPGHAPRRHQRPDRGDRGPGQRLRPRRRSPPASTAALGRRGRRRPPPTNGIPAAALAAYQRAETVINAADKSCNIPWQLIAAIGRVESDHGRYGGNTLDAEGVATPGIYGIALDGSNGTPAISDTDAGQYDDDADVRPRGRPDAVHPLDLVGRGRRRRRRRQAQPAGHRRRGPRHRRLPLLRRRRPLAPTPASGPRSSATTTARPTSTWCCRSWTPTSPATSPRCPTAPPSAGYLRARRRRPAVGDHGGTSGTGSAAPAATAAPAAPAGGTGGSDGAQHRRAAPAAAPSPRAPTGPGDGDGADAPADDPDAAAADAPTGTPVDDVLTARRGHARRHRRRPAHRGRGSPTSALGELVD